MRWLWRLLAVGWVAALPPQIGQAVAGAVLVTGSEPPNAATTTVTADVQINVEGGELVLVALPTLTFTELSVGDLIAGPKQLALANPAMAGRIEVRDTRGTNAGWQLSAQLGHFYQQADATRVLIPQSARFEQAQAQGGNATTIVLRTTDYSRQPATLVNAPAGRGSGLVSILVTGAEVTLPKTVAAKAGKYVATLTWVLAAQPEPTS